MMKSFLLLHFLCHCCAVFAFAPRQAAPQHAVCRFSPQFSHDEILHNSTAFEASIFYWDGQFHQDSVGYHQQNGLTIDNTMLGYATGLPQPLSSFGPSPARVSNARNEAYHIMLNTLAINGSLSASTFIYPANPSSAAQIAASILSSKLQTYLTFNNAYPGYGGFLPDFRSDGTMMEPTHIDQASDSGKLSAADNGLLMWAVYGLINTLEMSGRPAMQQLGSSWARWFMYARANAKNIFMRATIPGDVCAIATLKPSFYTDVFGQNYTCERQDCLNNDPFEGELLTWKRPQLIATNYTGSVVDGSQTQPGATDYSHESIKKRHITPITVQKGLHFASNEQIKLLFLPYRDVEIVSRVYMNAEYVRTCNSVLMGRTPGMFSRTPNATVSSSAPNSSMAIETEQIQNAGVPSAAVFQEQELDMITPSSVFPTILFDRGIGLAWYKNMLDGKQMQSVYGSLAATRRDGSAVAREVNWENKAPTLLALLGGIVDIVRDGMKRDNIYDEFIQVTEREYGDVFESSRNGGAALMGEKVGLCMPNAQVPGQTLNDFSTCASASTT
ncbi:hypothetical protein PMZ80_008912 [Knufia obscura]|uniref:Endo-beta-1,2-glucanase SGL domain-containing protein n=1 Tax=Knufia obscura TaxID=1635080 RepID=A0ABR0REN2_9EURO|nr:hypothetical protein PMZ80_008912 [Knufia obscura]